MWLTWWMQRRKLQKFMEEQYLMIQEIEAAKEDWINAERKWNEVVEKDQIDYSIYALEAAEKRYEMLLRRIKKEKNIDLSIMKWNQMHWMKKRGRTK